MDVVGFAKYLYKKYGELEAEKARMISLGYAKTYDEYKRGVGYIEGLATAREEVKAFLDKLHDDEDLDT